MSTRPPGFVLTILMHDSDGTRKYCQVGDESRAGVAMRTAFDGRLPKRSQILAHDSREDLELTDYIARFAAGEALPITRRTA
jgi:hypothetical protein